MFLAAAVWAALSQAIWLGTLVGGVALPTGFDPVAWHIHEMMFGFVVATIAGFMLTAIPNWTGRLPVRGVPLLLLVTAWLAGRFAIAASGLIGTGPALALDISFLGMFLVIVTRELVAGRNWRNLPMAAALAVLTASNFGMHAEVAGWFDLGGASWRLALAVVVFLISLVGGRIIPSFTRNWLAKNTRSSAPAAFGPVDWLAHGTTAAALATWTFAPDLPATGAALLAAGVLQGARLLRWRGLRARAEALVLVLHVAYVWGPAGLCLLGASILLPGLSPMLATHALTIGLIGGMILAVMTRATLGHTGRQLHADGPTVAIYALVNLAALARIAAELLPERWFELINISGAAWIGAFALFSLVYGRYLLGARPG